MTFRSSIAGLALAGTAMLLGSTALCQPIVVPVAGAPAAGAPVADPDEGLEAREAGAPRGAAPTDPVVAAIPGTLNAQFAAFQANPSLAGPEPEPPPPAAAPAEPVAVAALAPVGVLPAPSAAPVVEPPQAAPPPQSVELASAPMPAPPPVAVAAAEVASPAPFQPASGTAAPPAGPSVALSRRVVESAQAFVSYMQRASAVKPQWVDAAGVAHAVETGGVYEQNEIGEGEVAYAALVALQSPTFVQTLEGAATDPMQRQSLARALMADPGVVLQTPGARGAAMRAASALGHLGYGLDEAGAAVKHSAYDMQHSAWSLTNVSEPQAALLRLKQRSAVRESLDGGGGRTLLASLSQAGDAGNAGRVSRVTPVVARGLTLAALAVLGEAGEDRGATLLPILAEASNAQCVKMARLNLYQCLSVAGPQYEDVFCLGEHAMMETARCVEAASGWTPASQAPVMPAMMAEAPVARPASIYVPVAMNVGAAGPLPSYAVASATMYGQR